MFGATFLVPVLTGFPPSTMIFFWGIGTLMLLLLSQRRSFTDPTGAGLSDLPWADLGP